MSELAKIVGWVLAPLSLALLLSALAMAFVWRRQSRAGLTAGLLGLSGLWVLSTPLAAHLLAHRLESSFPVELPDQAPAGDAIVVLGGGLSGASLPERPSFDLGLAADRVWHAAALYRAGKAPWVLVSGGNLPGHAGMQIEAEAARSMLMTLGVPASAIRLEGHSRNTVENARETLPLIHEVGARRVLLVTSALHMPRALEIFRAATQDTGVTILPVSSDVEGLSATLHPLGRWLPDATALDLSTRALKEFLGLLALRLTRD